MTNLQEITQQQLKALKDFATAEKKELVAQLEEILDDVAKTGQYIFPWHFMKPLYAHKLDKVTEEFLSLNPPLKADGTEDSDEVEKLKDFRSELLVMFDKFIAAPFTIQRVSELLTNPKKHYKSTAKFFRGLEKNILVVSTVDHVPADQRPILKRSHDEGTAEQEHNSFLDVKPPTKKSVLEETPAVVSKQQNGEKNGSENTIPSVDSTASSDVGDHKNSSISECTTNNNTEQDDSNDKFTSMLLCTEQVNDISETSDHSVNSNVANETDDERKSITGESKLPVESNHEESEKKVWVDGMEQD